MSNGYHGHYAKPKKSKLWIFLVLILIAAAVVAGFLFLKNAPVPEQQPEPTTYPTETAEAEQATEAMELVQENPYRDILQQYATAIEEKWSVEQLAPTDLGQKIASYDGYDGLGYAYMDLNGDGIDELIITDGSAIYALYTIVDGKVQPQWLGFENMECWLCEDDVLVEVHEGMGWYYVFMKLGETVLEPFYTMTYAPEKDAENPWFQGNPYTQPDAASLDGGEAVARLESYQQIYIRNTPFRLGIDGGQKDDYVPENPEIYLSAIQGLQDNYIYADPMTYTFYDFDEDGTRELLLGSGNAIRSVWKVQNGQVEKIWESANESFVYLCEDGILWDSSMRGNWFTDMDGNVVEFVYHSDETDSWYMKNKEKSPDVPIDESQAKEILASFQRIYLDWKPITDYPMV